MVAWDGLVGLVCFVGWVGCLFAWVGLFGLLGGLVWFGLFVLLGGLVWFGWLNQIQVFVNICVSRVVSRNAYVYRRLL